MHMTNTLSAISSIVASGAIMLGISGCGTTSSVNQPMSGPAWQGPVYAMGTCKTTDSDASQETCNELRDKVQYGLIKRGLYAKSTGAARRTVNLTITDFRDVGAWGRAWGGVMAGKDALEATVDVIDNQSGKVVGSANASTFNVTALNTTEGSMIGSVSEQLVEFLASGTN